MQRTFADFYRGWYGPSKPGTTSPAIVPEQKSAGLQVDMERHTAPSLVPAGTAGTADPLIGQRLRLDRTCDRRGGCCQRMGVIHPGSGPHRYSLRCVTCDRHRGWLASTAADVLLALYQRGDLSASPSLRDRGIVP